MKSNRVLLFLGVALAGACGDELPGPDAAPSVRAPAAELPERAVFDDAGLPQYTVFLDEAALGVMPREAARDERFAAYHAAPAVHLVQAIERGYGIAVEHMTTRVGLSLTAYMAPETAAAIAADPRVTSVVANQYVELSSDSASVWQDGTGTGVGSEHVAWGTTALGAGAVSTTRVYVIDTGVTPNATELNIESPERNAYCPHNEVNTHCTTVHPPVIGCYPHSTHVAGIIGARQNTAGTRGIAPGVTLVSIAVTDPLHVTGSCLTVPGPTNPVSDDILRQALEWVTEDVTAHASAGVAVVNMSLNGSGFVGSGVIATAMRAAVTPHAGYPGVFIAESAGNDFQNACTHAYTTAAGGESSTDGIMTVGMLNDHGQAVRPLNGGNGSRNQPLAADEPGSNYGACVEVWAPGRSIFSTWAGSYQYLTGTSMASPHIAGLAARLASSAATPGALETAVRSHLVTLGSVDQAGLPIKMPSMVTVPTPHQTPYAEVAAAASSVAGTTPETTPLVYSDQGINVALDSVGAGSYTCDLYRRIGTTGTPVSLAAASAHISLNVAFPVGLWNVYSNTCPSAHTQVSSVQRSSVHWYINNVLSDNASLTLPANSTAQIRYASTNATTCDFSVINETGFGPFGPVAGYPHNSNGANATVSLLTTPQPYGYLVSCHDGGGIGSSAYFHVTVTAVTGACTPGDTESCCPCSGGCGCIGNQTCNAQSQWGSCREYVCHPGVCN